MMWVKVGAHRAHVVHARHVPAAQVAVEPRSAGKHVARVTHTRDVPLAHVAVILIGEPEQVFLRRQLAVGVMF